MEWQGVPFFTLNRTMKPKDKATHVFYKGFDGYSANTTLDAVMDDDTCRGVKNPSAPHTPSQ